MKESLEKNQGSIFELEGIPPLKQVVPLGFQHVVSAIVGIVTPAILVANLTEMSPSDQTLLVQISLVVTALSTLLQLFPIGNIGAGLPVITGMSFAYVPTILAIGGQFGISAILGAQIVGGVVAYFVGKYVKYLRKFFPPIITGTVIFTIGLSLYPVAIRYMAGGAGSPTFGSPKNWIVAIITLIVVIFCTYFTKGITKLAAILIGMIAGYLVSLSMGMVYFDPVREAGWFQIARPLHFGLEFKLSAIISMVTMYIVNSVQSIGDISSTTLGGLDREPTDKELAGGIKANGLISILGAFVGGLPTATFSQNVGIVTVNRVVNKMVFAFAAMVFFISGLIPKFASILTTIPQSVIGGATLSVFAMITMTGIKMINPTKLSARDTGVVSLAIALGIGVTSVPGALGAFPEWVEMVFGGSAVVISTLTAIILNSVLPRDKEKEEVSKINDIETVI